MAPGHVHVHAARAHQIRHVGNVELAQAGLIGAQAGLIVAQGGLIDVSRRSGCHHKEEGEGSCRVRWPAAQMLQHAQWGMISSSLPGTAAAGYVCCCWFGQARSDDPLTQRTPCTAYATLC